MTHGGSEGEGPRGDGMTEERSSARDAAPIGSSRRCRTASLELPTR